MTDKISPQARSRNMSVIRSKRTKIEDKFTKELWNRGIRFRRNVHNLKGKPDIAIKNIKSSSFLTAAFGFHVKYMDTSQNQIQTIGLQNSNAISKEML